MWRYQRQQHDEHAAEWRIAPQSDRVRVQCPVALAMTHLAEADKGAWHDWHNSRSGGNLAYLQNKYPELKLNGWYGINDAHDARDDQVMK